MNKNKLINELKTHQLFISAMGTEKDEHISAGVGIAIDLIQKHDDWISVKDELPDAGQYVLVWSENYIYISVAETFCDAGEWVTAFDDDKISHWMPLPDPPKGD